MSIPDSRDIQSAAADALAFSTTVSTNRHTLIKSLLSDPRVAVFDKTIVRWLVERVEKEREKTRDSLQSVMELQDRIAELEAKRPAVQKSKAIVKQAKIIAQMAQALNEVQEAHRECDVYEYSPIDDWRKVHRDILEAAKDGD